LVVLSHFLNYIVEIFYTQLNRLFQFLLYTIEHSQSTDLTIMLGSSFRDSIFARDAKLLGVSSELKG